MELNQKKKLLQLCNKYIKKINDYESSAFVDFLANSSRSYYLTGRTSREYINFLYYAQKQANQILNGGKAVQESYKKFMQNELRLKKQGEEIKVENADFAKLSIDEFAYIWGWLRRMATRKTNFKTREDKGKVPFKTEGKKSSSSKTFNDEPNQFAVFFRK